MKVIVIPITGEHHELEIADAGAGPSQLADMQAIVGGYVESVGLFLPNGMGVRPDLIGWLNEDGKGLGLPYNEAATALCRRANAMRTDDVVVGSFFITGPPDAEGDITTVNPFAAAILLSLLRQEAS